MSHSKKNLKQLRLQKTNKSDKESMTSKKVKLNYQDRKIMQMINKRRRDMIASSSLLYHEDQGVLDDSKTD